MLVGDWTDIVSANEQKGGGTVDSNRCRFFQGEIHRCGLLDLGYVGAKFTWHGPKWNDRDRVFKRLDRALSNISWRIRFPDAIVKTLPRVHSNHQPLCINVHPEIISNFQRPFRFMAAWLEHENFSSLLYNCWKDQINLVENLSVLIPALLDWNKNVFGNIHKKKKELLARINGIQGASSYGHNPFLDDLELLLQGS